MQRLFIIYVFVPKYIYLLKKPIYLFYKFQFSLFERKAGRQRRRRQSSQLLAYPKQRGVGQDNARNQELQL